MWKWGQCYYDKTSLFQIKAVQHIAAAQLAEKALIDRKLPISRIYA